MPKSKELKFEQALQRLEEVVQKLESDRVDLDDSLKLFEEGVQLARACQTQLAETKKKIDVYVKETESLQPFQESDLPSNDLSA